MKYLLYCIPNIKIKIINIINLYLKSDHIFSWELYLADQQWWKIYSIFWQRLNLKETLLILIKRNVNHVGVLTLYLVYLHHNKQNGSPIGKSSLTVI